MHTSITRSLISYLLPVVRTNVLARLLIDEREWHARELARVLGLNHAAVTDELRNLAEAGIAIKRRSSNRVYYSANKQCAIYEELKNLLIKTAGLADVLRQALAELGERITLAYVYGSFAEGSDNAESDIDLMVVGSVTLGDVVDALGEAEERLAREINATVYSAIEYKQKLAAGRGFIHQVHYGQVIMLLGALDELE